ncbi:hypothetical protein K1719_047357 [Acacia pycnantha]|nr:hypothetical protein K1719_047357 [Acacia pycnantha]
MAWFSDDFEFRFNTNSPTHSILGNDGTSSSQFLDGSYGTWRNEKPSYLIYSQNLDVIQQELESIQAQLEHGDNAFES